MEAPDRITKSQVERCVQAVIRSKLLIGNGNFERYICRCYATPDHCDEDSKPHAYLSIWIQHAAQFVEVVAHGKDKLHALVLCMYGDTLTQDFMRIENYAKSHHTLNLNTIRDEKSDVMECVKGKNVNHDIIRRPHSNVLLAELSLETTKAGLSSKNHVYLKFNPQIHLNFIDKLLAILLAFKTTFTKYRAIVQPQRIIPPDDLSDMNALEGINQCYIFKESAAVGKKAYLHGYFRLCRVDGSVLPLYFESVTNRRDGCPMRLLTNEGKILLTIGPLMPFSVVTNIYNSDELQIGSIKKENVRCIRYGHHDNEKNLSGFLTANENESYTLKYAKYHGIVGKVVRERTVSNLSRIWVNFEAAVDGVQRALILAYAMKQAFLQFRIHTEIVPITCITRLLSEPIDVERLINLPQSKQRNVMREQQPATRNQNYQAPQRYSVQRAEFYRSQGVSLSSALETFRLESSTTTSPSQTSSPSQATPPSKPASPSQPTPESPSADA